MELSARTAYRGQVTKIVKSAIEFLDSPNSQPNKATDLEALEEDLSVFIQRLTAALETLTVTDQEIQKKGLLKDEELDKELEKVAEYQDVAISALSRLKTRIKKVQRKLTPTTPISPPDRASLDTSMVNCSLKLPKLQLKKFDGNFQDWLPFWEQFRSAIHENDSLTSTDKFSYLESVLVGSAKKIIAGFTASSMCYDAAISLLQEQFGDPERLIDKNMQQLVSLRSVQSRTDIAGLRNLYNSITSCCRTLTALQIPTQQYYVMLKSILLRCLPAELRVDYFRLGEKDDHMEKPNEIENESSSTSLQIGDTQVKSIMRFLKREVESLERSRAISFTPSTVQSRHTPSTAACLMSLKGNSICAFCNSHQHLTKDCDCKLSITEKREMLRKNNCCFRCAKRGHSSKKCRSAKWICCDKCKGRHITSLCDPSYNREKTFVTSSSLPKNADREHVINLCAGKISTPQMSQPDSIQQSATNLCAYNSLFDNTNVFLKTARGIAVSPSKNKSLLIRFVIDGGSQYSYIREDLATKLNLQSMGEVNFSLIPFGCKEQAPFRKFKKVKVHIRSQYSNESVKLEAVVVPEICVDVLHAPDPSCALVQNLQLADSCHTSEEAVNGLSVLIGSNYYWSVVTGKQRRISKGLRAVHTIFGWTLQGAHFTGKQFVSNENSFSPSIHSTTLHLPALSSNDFTSFWSLEAIGIRGEDEENKHLADELAAQCIAKNGLRYEASLPWKNPDVEIKSNRECALKRLESLASQLSRYPEKYREYDAGIWQLLTDGFAESVPPQNKENVHRVFYLPHRPVYKEDSTTTKMRIVFDASSRSQDSPSLNDLLHVGANLLPDVLKILLNFRLGPYGIVADVEKAFLQIELNEKDRDTHRFLWYAFQKTPTCQPEILEYRMTRVTFGVNCSPFLLTATLQLHFKNEKGKLQSTCRKLMESFYMDDLAMSVDTEVEGVHVSKDAVLVMKGANMNLRKWNSNSNLVRQAHCSDELPSEQKVLGLLWFVHTDEIGVPLKSIEDLFSSNLVKGTKRNVLQMIARVYDPLGMLGPVVIGLKILFQAIWREKISWDEMLTGELLLQWQTWVENFKPLKNYAIPRAAINCSLPMAIHIHIFADASLKAYGTVAFIKSFDEAGRNNISFLCAKSRVAPLKTEKIKELSLPKLELTAALLAARMSSYLQKSLKIPIQKFFLWTDSKIALGLYQVM